MKNCLILQSYPTQKKLPKKTQIIFKEHFKQLRYIIKSYLITYNNTLKNNNIIKHLTLKDTFK